MLKKNYTKKELSNRVYRNLGFSKNFSSAIIDDFLKIITSELEKLNKVKLSSFGTFVITNKKERVGRNPKTKVEVKICARRVVKFKPSMMIKRKLNSQ